MNRAEGGGGVEKEPALEPSEVAKLRALLAAVDCREPAVQAARGLAAVSENGIDADGGASQGEAPLCKTYLFKDREKWRFRVIDTVTKKKTNHIFDSRDEAEAAMVILGRTHRRPVGVPMSEALSAYREHLATRGNRPGCPNRPRTIETTLARLTRCSSRPVPVSSPGSSRRRWSAYGWAAYSAARCSRPGRRGYEIEHHLCEDGGRCSSPSRPADPAASSRMLAKGKQPNDRLFGDVNRHWVLRSCRRLCQTAGVPVVPAHGLRGTHAKLAVEAGISGYIVAASLGHESFATTAGHYAGADAVADAAASRVANALD